MVLYAFYFFWPVQCSENKDNMGIENKDNMVICGSMWPVLGGSTLVLALFFLYTCMRFFPTFWPVN